MQSTACRIMYKRLLLPILSVSAVILVTGFQAIEHWTVVEHAIEALKRQGPFGEFVAGIITSPILPLVLALLTILIVIEIWREQRDNKELAVEPPAKPLPSINESGNSTVIASPTISPIISPVFQTNYPSPVIAETTPEPRLTVDVKFTPWQGQFDKMYLTVTNQGPAQTFEAECQILARRNDPKPATVANVQSSMAIRRARFAFGLRKIRQFAYSFSRGRQID
jgi:hypothetical protein